ncbi:MAG: hypothetical protein HY070_02320 [Chloroflexi bacterium]|nr:hypothetical protein [Chloroflexota bacterium]MBI3741015.1 hypothetical protein [Chloroflexota bacterium]MBI3741728.1 hypothetical protein [Chloroflexota bacterium]
MITREQVRDQVVDVLNHRMTPEQFVEWVNRNPNEFTTRDYVPVKALAEKINAASDHGLAWEEYYNFLTAMKFRVKVSVG